MLLAKKFALFALMRANLVVLIAGTCCLCPPAYAQTTLNGAVALVEDKAQSDSPAAEEKAEKKEGSEPEKKEGDKPEAKEGDKPEAKEGDTPEKKEGDKPEKKEGDKPEKKEGDKPEKKEGDKPEKKEGDKPEKKEGDKPEKKEGDKPEKKEGDKTEKKEGDKPEKKEAPPKPYQVELLDKALKDFAKADPKFLSIEAESLLALTDDLLFDPGVPADIADLDRISRKITADNVVLKAPKNRQKFWQAQMQSWPQIVGLRTKVQTITAKMDPSALDALNVVLAVKKDVWPR